MEKSLETSVAAHYGRGGLAEAILDGVAAAGLDPDALTIEDLAPVDEFHTAGRMATLTALAMTALEAGMHVLDAGCGIGGTSRCLAVEHGCRVTGIDLTPEYVDVARMLTDRLGLADACRFDVGSATDMPYAEATFDAAVSFHVAMNIEDRQAFYGEMARVVRPGGPLCIFDVMKGPTAGMVYPVPWAETEVTSFLRSPDETSALLEESGFAVTAVASQREMASEFFRAVFARAAEADGPPPLGLHLLTGSNGPEKFANYVQALDAHQIDPTIIVAERR